MREGQVHDPLRVARSWGPQSGTIRIVEPQVALLDDDGPLRQELQDLTCVDGTAQAKALKLVAAPIGEKALLGGGLHTFRDDAEPELVRHGDGGRDDRLRPRVPLAR